MWYRTFPKSYLGIFLHQYIHHIENKGPVQDQRSVRDITQKNKKIQYMTYYILLKNIYYIDFKIWDLRYTSERENIITKDVIITYNKE